MARQEDLDLLRQGTEAWNQYRTTEPGRRPDLRNAVLSGLDLTAADLRMADLKGADLGRSVLREADLYKAELNGAILVEADLSGGDLVAAVLTEADLSHATLRDANLLGAQFGRAELTGADLTRAELGWANFNGSKLSDARLRDSRLIEAIFHRCTLTGTDFTGALIASTLFSGVDLRTPLGLAEARYRNPSELTLSTFFLSRGQIPEELLRGAEVPGNFMRHNQALFVHDSEYYSCFISYSHQDREFAHQLDRDLREAGVRTWLDDRQVYPGDYLYDVIDEGIQTWDKVLLCCSRSSLHSRWVGVEIDKALQKEERLWKERKQRVLALIPLNLDDYLFDWEDGKRSELTSRFAPDFSRWQDEPESYRKQVGRLLKALQVDGRDEPPEPRL